MENKSIGALWQKTAKNGSVYFSGKCFEKRIVVFKNKKTSEKQPDYTILESNDNYKTQNTNQESNIDATLNNIIF